MQNRQNNFNYNQYYTPSMNNQYLYNKNKENMLNQPNNNTRAFSPNPNKTENKQINTRNYTYLNKQEIPLKNSNKQNIPNQRSPQPYSNIAYKENISTPSNTKNYFSPNPNQTTEKVNLNEFNTETKNYPITTNYNSNKNKKTLILDLDETLVHSGFHPFNRKSDFTLNIKVDGKNHTIYVLKRPYVEEFLSQIAPYFEIVIFTASISEYASPLIDMLDKNKLTSGRLFRQHCLFNHGLYLKDIKIIQKDLKDVIIIDNNPVSYVMNQDNGLPILTWYDDLNDKELLNFIPLLKYLSKQNDVRDVIKNIVDKQNNKIKFDIVDELINKKINENNTKKEIIYQANDNYNKNINNNNNIISKDIRKKDNFNTNSTYKQNYINNYVPNKYEIKSNEKLENNRNYNNIIKEEENKIKKYFNDNNNFYLYNNYNNSIHDSLSNMTYNEIQNEGTINNENEYQNDYENNSKNNNITNNMYKGSQNYVIQQAINYDNHKHYEERNKINNFNRQNELLNKGNNERKEIRAHSNSNYEYKINNYNNNLNVNKMEQKPIKKNYTSNTYNPKYNNNQEQKLIKNDFYLPRENYNNNNYYEERYTNNLNNNELRKNKLYERIKDNNYISENNQYLENLTIENKEKDDNLSDNYLKLYQQQLLKLRTNEKNYQNNNLSNNNNNINNIHIYQNKNNNSPYIQNLNNPNNNLNRNHSINSLNYRRNNMNLINFNNNNEQNLNMNNNMNNIYNQRFVNDNQQNDLLKREEKDNLLNDELDNIPDVNRQRLNTNLRFFKTQNNFMQSYKDRNKNLFNINNNYNNQNNNFRFNNNFRRNNEEKDERNIQPKMNNYFNNNNENELNRSFSSKKFFLNNRISNIDLDRKARERKKYNYTPYYVNRNEQNQINIRNINLNNNMNSGEYMNQRNDTDVYNEKMNEEFSLNNDKNQQNNNTDYKNKIFEYKRENNYYNKNFNEKINNFKKEYQNENNNENPPKYSEKLSRTEERRFYRSSSSKPNINSNNYNYLYNNENSRIPRNYNSININNYNFYNSFIGNNANNKEKERIDENHFYNNKYRMQYYANKDDDQTNELNRSSSYFHPRQNYYSMLNNKNENTFTPNALKRNNVLKTKFLNNLGNY